LILLPSPPLKDAKKTKKARFGRFFYITSIDSCIQSLYNDCIPKKMKEAEIIRYKAIDRFFDNGEKERESLCGFGYCRVIGKGWA